LAYIGLVYAFLADIAIFGVHFVPLELMGVGVILIFNIMTMWIKMKK